MLAVVMLTLSLKGNIKHEKDEIITNCCGRFRHNKSTPKNC